MNDRINNMELWKNDSDSRNRSTMRKLCPSPTLYTLNPTLNGLGLNPDFCSDRPVTIHLSHGMAPSLSCWYVWVQIQNDSKLTDTTQIMLLWKTQRVLSNPEVHKFSKNLDVTSRFWAPERSNEASSKLRPHNVRYHCTILSCHSNLERFVCPLSNPCVSDYQRLWNE